MAQRRVDLQNRRGTQEAMAQTWRLQVGGDSLNDLSRLGELCLSLLIPAQPRQDLAESGLAQLHLTWCLDLLGQPNRGCQYLGCFLKPPACRQALSL
jgi:hypothetical protein